MRTRSPRETFSLRPALAVATLLLLALVVWFLAGSLGSKNLEIARLSRQNEVYQGMLDKADRRAQEGQQIIHSWRNAVHQEGEKNLTLQVEIKQLEQQLKLVERTCEHWKSLSETNAGKASGMDQQLAQKAWRLERLEAELRNAAKETELARKKAEEYKQELRGALDEIARRERDSLQNRQRFSALQNELAATGSQRDALANRERLLTEMENNLKGLTQELLEITPQEDRAQVTQRLAPYLEGLGRAEVARRNGAFSPR